MKVHCGGGHEHGVEMWGRICPECNPERGGEPYTAAEFIENIVNREEHKFVKDVFKEG